MAHRRAAGDSRTYFQTSVGEDHLVEGPIEVEIIDVTPERLALPAPETEDDA